MAGVEAKTDKCPFSKMDGVDDSAEEIDSLSCGSDAYMLLKKINPYLARFLDRDGDTLTDAEEDFDLSGGTPNILTSKCVDGVPDPTIKSESDPLRVDTDNDGTLTDNIEVKNLKTNPADQDTDCDGLTDLEEVGYDGDFTTNKFTLNVVVSDGSKKDSTGKKTVCWDNPSEFGDTDALNADSDDDGIPDNIEINLTKTNPVNIDSDNDGINDNIEDKNTNGIWPEFENGKLVTDLTMNGIDIVADFSDTNACSSDTDGDGLTDNDPKEAFPCAANPEISCQPDPNAGGLDSDNDGVADIFEYAFGTDPSKPDTDMDHVIDGKELWYHLEQAAQGTPIWNEKSFLPEQGESDPNPCVVDETEAETYAAANVGGVKVYYSTALVGDGAAGTANFCGLQVGKTCGADSDGDGMPDFAEYKYGTNPSKVDTDGDGIIDGIESGWLVAEAVDLENQIYRLKPSSGQFEYLPGSSYTNANNPQTDEDGLIDGFSSDQNYEDRNCNGRRDVNAQNRPIETDPRNANSDGDKWGDGEEFCWNGVCNGARALSPQREGCQNIGGSGGETWGMTIMFAIMLVSTRVVTIVIRRTKRSKARR
jgi:hypothetical protein